MIYTKKICTIMIFLLCSKFAAAENFFEFLSRPVKVELNSCSTDKDLSLEKKCVAELCQNEKQSSSLITNDKIDQFLQTLPKKLNSDNIKKINALAKKKISLYQAELKKLESLSERFTQLSQYEKDTIFRLRFDENCNRSIDQNLPLANRIDIQCAENFEIPPELLKEYHNNELQTYTSYFYNIDEYASYEELPALLSMSRSSQNSLLEKLPKNIQDKYQNRIKEIDALSINLSTDPSMALKVASKMYDLNYDLSRENGIEPTVGRFECKSDACLNFIKQELSSKEFQQKIKKNIKSLDDPNVQKQIVASMKVTQSLFLNSPSKEEFIKYEKKLDNLKNTVKNKMKSWMSKESFEIYSKKLNEVVYEFSEGRDLISEEIPKEIEDIEELLLLAHAKNDKGLVLWVAGNWLPYQLVSDAFGGGTFWYSRYSMENPEQGLNTAAHELGHHLSFASKDLPFEVRQKISSARKCLRERYDEFYRQTGKGAGSFYEEENFGDEFASMIYKGSPLTECGSFSGTSINSSYAIIPLSDPNDDHQHPSDIWRLLNQALYRDKPLPNSCKELVERRDIHGVQYKKCL